MLCFINDWVITMISVQELETLCKDKLEDAKTLFNAGRYDSAVYLCGYVVEIILKKRICMTLGWPGYPSKGKEFENLTSLRTHDLDILLRLSGIENILKNNLMYEWSKVSGWNPEIRYSPRTQTKEKAEDMLSSTEKLLEQI